jgi:hypothetical protein
MSVDTASGSQLYLLDDKSGLILTNGKVIPHKFLPPAQAAAPAPAPAPAGPSDLSGERVTRPGSVGIGGSWLDEQFEIGFFGDQTGFSFFGDPFGDVTCAGE